jgi:hypothetical protein
VSRAPAVERMTRARRKSWLDWFERRRMRLWASDEGLTALLVFVGLLVFVVLPLQAMGLLGVWAATAIDLWFGLIVLAGVVSIGRRRSAAIVVTILLVGLLAVHLVDNWSSAAWLNGLEAGLTIVLVSIVAVLMLAQVYRAGPVTRQRIEGAIGVYLLIGLLWSQAYLLMLFFEPGALHGVTGEESRLNGRLVYFSFVTLTSTGYGDVTPASPLSQSLANLESIVGQLFPAVLLARLVSLQLTSGNP